MNQIFTIVWVEDNPDAMRSQISGIEDYLKERLFAPDVIIDTDGSALSKILKDKQPIDIVVTDKNITNDISGMDVVNLVRANKGLTDILFYSSKGYKPKDIKEQTAFVDVIEGKEIYDRLKLLIDKNLQRYDDVVLLRGIVLSMIIDLETKINDFFARYFEIPEKHISSFRNFILECKYGSLAGKQATIAKIVRNAGFDKKFSSLHSRIQKLSEARNLLAHCKVDSDDKSVLICMGDKSKFDRDRVKQITREVVEISANLDELIEQCPLTKKQRANS